VVAARTQDPKQFFFTPKKKPFWKGLFWGIALALP